MIPQPTPNIQIPNLLDAYSRVERFANRCDSVLNRQEDERLFDPKVQGLARVMIGASKAQVLMGAQIERLNRPKSSSSRCVCDQHLPDESQDEVDVSQEEVDSLLTIIDMLEAGVAVAEAMCGAPPPVISNPVRNFPDESESPSNPLIPVNPDEAAVISNARLPAIGLVRNPPDSGTSLSALQPSNLSLSQNPFECSEKELNASIVTLETEVSALETILRSSSNAQKPPQTAMKPTETASPPSPDAQASPTPPP